MEIAFLILEYMKVLVWPVTAITIVFLFRVNLKGILSRLSNGELDALGVKVRVDLNKAQEEVQRAEEHASGLQLDAIQDAELREAQAHLVSDFEEHFKSVEKIHSSPESATERIISWTFIAYLQTVIDCATALGHNPINSRFPGKDLYSKAVLELEALGVFNEDMANAAQRLMRIYNSQFRNSTPPEREFADLYFSTAYELAELVVSSTKNAMHQRNSTSG
ncbi:hypothetical protein [Glutamicibacter nicotianae]|uniref:DUF4129 domain-containing protein n=1 Tax=Glutamicibacter nicotianae TaxID=37929 RepID=A0ABQ0RJU9_GLUNI|nr:hypothetical protein [Glutamicibacter nicotianae]GEC12092.1 hypothetical protein ANI01nite_12950 [Glutamicibacter nicotianae]